MLLAFDTMDTYVVSMVSSYMFHFLSILATVQQTHELDNTHLIVGQLTHTSFALQIIIRTLLFLSVSLALDMTLRFGRSVRMLIKIYAMR